MIIKKKSLPVPELDGVIYIDCWEPGSHEATVLGWYKQLGQQIQTYNIKSHINAATFLNLEHPDQTVIQTLQTYAWSPYDHIGWQHHPRANRLLANIFRHASMGTRNKCLTSSALLETVFNNDISFHINDCLDLVFHNDYFHHNQTNKWLIVGGDWGLCLHNNNIGIKKLSRLSYSFPQLEFYITPWGCKIDNNTIGINENHIKHDSQSWYTVPGFGWKLAADSTDPFPNERYQL